MTKKLILLMLVFSIKIASAQKIPSLYYHAKGQVKEKRSLVILSQNSQTTFVSFYNKELSQIWRKKTPQQVNTEYRNKPNISSFSYSNKTGYVKLAAPTNVIRQVLKKEFDFSDKELTIKGL
jgi:hypothetical protein